MDTNVPGLVVLDGPSARSGAKITADVREALINPAVDVHVVSETGHLQLTGIDSRNSPLVAG